MMAIQRHYRAVLKKILHKSPDVLPDYTYFIDLSNMFGHFFREKIIKFKSGLQISSLITLIRPSPRKYTLTSFTFVSEYDIVKFLASSPTKTCDLDPIPTSLVKECTAKLLLPIFLNYSLKEGSFSQLCMPFPFSKIKVRQKCL